MRWLLSMLAVACGGQVARPPLEHRASHPRPPRCTPQLVDTLAATLRARWGADELELRCAAGHFGIDGYFVDAQGRTARGTPLHRTGVVDASGAEVVAFVDEPPIEPRTYLNGYAAADLDGDGADEIVESWRRAAHAGLPVDRWLVVRQISAGTFTRIQGPFLSRFHPELGGCSGTWELRANAIVIAVRRHPGIPPTDCLPEGRHAFTLQGSALTDRTLR